MKKKAILFDFDGVIADSEPLYQKVEQDFFDVHNIQLSDDEWAEIKGISAPAFFKLIKEKYIPDMDIDQVQKEMEKDLRNEFKKNLTYVRGFQELIPQLKDHFFIGIVTATAGKVMNYILNNTPVRPSYDILITADDINNSKPHPEPYIKAAEMLQIPIENCLVIEDSVNGLRSGKAAGANVLALTTSLSADYLSEADFIAEDFRKLTLDKINGFFKC